MGIEVLLGVIGKLIGSSATGSLFGWIGGWLQRKQDLAARRLELEFERDKLSHELKLREADMLIMKQEAESRERIASIETGGKIEVAQLDAIAQGYQQQFGGEGKAAGFSRVVRPLLTFWFAIASSALTAVVLWVAWSRDVQFSADQWQEWVRYAIEWVFFQASVAIGWWFAMRTGKLPEPARR